MVGGCRWWWVCPRVGVVTVPGNPVTVQALRPLRGRLRRARTATGTRPGLRHADARRDQLITRPQVCRLPPGPGAARTRPRSESPTTSGEMVPAGGG